MSFYKKVHVATLGVLFASLLFLGVSGAARAEKTPTGNFPVGWVTRCGSYTAAQNTYISQPPTRDSAGKLYFKNQQPQTVAPGGTFDMVILLTQESCPSNGSSPVATSTRFRGVSVNNGATVSVTKTFPFIERLGYPNNTSEVETLRVYVKIKLPSNAGSGQREFALSVDVGGKINDRGSSVNPRYQCVQSPSDGRAGDTQSSYFDYTASGIRKPCFSNVLNMPFQVNVTEPLKWDYRYKDFNTGSVRTKSITNTESLNGIDIASLPQSAAGTKVPITTRLRNDGNATGSAFQQNLEYKWLNEVGDWKLVAPGVQHSEFPADGGGSNEGNHDRSITREYQIPGDTASGRAICFRARINNFTGTSVNGVKTVTSGNAWRTIGNETQGLNNPSGTIRCLRVNGGAVQPACTLSANPLIVDAGGTATLTWTSQRAQSATLQGATVGLNGSQAVTVTIPGTQYTVEVESSSGATARCSVTINVRNNRPFIRADGSDVFSGAIFGTGYQGSCSNTTSLVKARDADIETNGYPVDSQTNGFSSSQYATFASGEIGDDASPDRFNNYSANNANQVPGRDGSVKDLLFANQFAASDDGTPQPGKYGHFYGSLDGTIPCLDTSSIQPKLQSATGTFADLLAASSSYVRRAGDLSIDAESVVSNQKIIWVDGMVTIKKSIRYDQSNYSSVNGQPKVPYLMLIATKGISIEGGNNGATQLDGTYVSLPTTPSDNDASNSNSGRLDTCSNIQGVPGLAAFVWPANGAGLTTSSCNQRLVVNGALIARRILWKRTSGTLGSPDQAALPSCTVINSTHPASMSLPQLNQQLQLCSSEFIKYNPEAYFGPFYTVPGANTGSVPIDTTELPPIY